MKSEILLPDGSLINLPVQCDLPVQEVEDAAADSRAPTDKGFSLLEKARTGAGSTAAAGSDFFHIYRKQRARELARLDLLEEEGREEELDQLFHDRREARIRAQLLKTAAKATKRRRAKRRRHEVAVKGEEP